MEIKKIFKNKFTSVIGVYIFCYLFVFLSIASAATLQINSNSSTISTGDTVILYVNVNSEGVAVNNAEATIKFPSDLFDVIAVSKSGSIFSLWVEEPTFSNLSGEVTFNGGIPTPGFNGSSGSVVSITARAKKVGQGEFTFSTAAVRANDGLGTDVLNSQQGKIVSVISRTEPVVVPPPTPEVKTESQNIQVKSITHPNQDLWYKDSNPSFEWNLPAGSEAVRTNISTVTSDIPTVTYSPAVGKKSIKDLDDGIWYFKVRVKQNGVWGAISSYSVKIDKTAPVKNSVSIGYDNNSRTIGIVSDIQDSTSGIDHYDIFANGKLLKSVLSGEFVLGSYKLAYDVSGDSSIKLVAVDRAGNSVDESAYISVNQVETSKSADSNSQFALFFVIFTVLAIIVLIMYAIEPYYHRFEHKQKMSSAISTGNHTKALNLIKKRLEKHLELLQETRHERILTREEKIIKEGIESDLDEIDKALGKN